MQHPLKFAGSSVFLVAVCALTPVVRADLLVLNQGGSGGFGQILRIDPVTGAPEQAFGHQNEGMSAMATTGREVLVTSDVLGDDTIYAFDRNGQYRGQQVPWTNQAQFGNVERGPDGKFYTTMYDSKFGHRRIVQLANGAAVPFTVPDAGGVTSPTAIAFGPDGNLYVADAAVGIARFNLTTGDFMDVFVPLGRGDLADIARMSFGPDGRLYIASRSANTVLRFDGTTGGFVDLFVYPGSGGLSNPTGLAFDPAGNLYLTSQGTRQVLEYDGATGAFVKVAYAASAPVQLGDLAFTTPLVASSTERSSRQAPSRRFSGKI